MAFPPRLAALPKLRSDPGCCSNPIAHRVRRKRQRLPPSLLIENASDRDPAPSPAVCPEAFPIKASDNPEGMPEDAFLTKLARSRLRGDRY